MNRNFAYFVVPAILLAAAASHPTLARGQSTEPLTVNQIQVDGTVESPANVTVSNPAGFVNAPYLTIKGDDNGVSRNAAQQLMIQGANNPAQQLLIGYVNKVENSNYNGFSSIQSTDAGVANTPLMLNPNGGGVYIGTNVYAGWGSALVIGHGQGYALADEWITYSSRRYKTDIKTLPDALSQVEKLRGVSYTRKDNGKHEIGVIAEEVGAVVPEIVSWEDNGKDARGVDYARLTALLIEATKQQQAEIEKQSAELADAMKQIKSQQLEIHEQKTAIDVLASQSKAKVSTLVSEERIGN